MTGTARRDSLLLGIVLAVALVLALLLSAAPSRSRGKSATSLSASSYSRGRNGLKALHDGLVTAGYRVTRTREPLTRLSERGTLVIAAPEIALLHSEISALQAWVAAGNDLILALSFDNYERAAGPLIMPVGRAGAAVPFPETPETLRPSFPGAALRGVRTVATRWGCRIAVRQWDPLGRPSNPEEQSPDDSNQPPLLPLIADSQGIVLGQSRLGRGRVITMADHWTPSNDGLRHADNIRLMLGLLGPPSTEKAVIFDEFHHGYRDVAAEPLFSMFTWAGLAQALLGFAIWASIRATRFGDPIPSPPSPRERTEYVDAMAQLLRRARGEDTARRILGQRFLRSMSKALGLPAGAEPARIAERARARGMNADEVGRLAALAQHGDERGTENLLSVAKQWQQAAEKAQRHRGMTPRGGEDK